MTTAQTRNPLLQPTAATVQARAMRAVAHRQYGEPSVLSVEDVPRPVAKDDEVLVRVLAVSATSGDHHVVTGKPYLIRVTPFGGLPRPKNLVLGQTLAGRVEAVGAKVTEFKPGDEVFGQTNTGAWAEYLAVPAKLLAPKPSNLTFQEAAAVPWGTTALQGLRDAGGLKAGQKVLIYGASGALGTWSVQLAKAYGAHVTAVCSGGNAELVRSLGADTVIDYTQEDFTAAGPRFDLMFDLVGNRSLADCRRAVVPGGTYVDCGGGGGDRVGPVFRLIALLITSLFSSRKLKTVMQQVGRKDLLVMKQLIEAGKVKPVIEKRFSIDQAAAALAHVGTGHSRGQTVIQIASA